MTGVVLLITAAVGLIAEKKMQIVTGGVLILSTIGALMIWKIPLERADSQRRLLAVEQSAYADLRVLDMNSRRHLLIDGGIHTIVDPASWNSHYPYVAVMDLAKKFFEQPGKLLLVGLGGGSLVKNFAREGWEVDAVEIDPVVTEVAFKHFGLEASEARIFHFLILFQIL